MPKSCRGQNKRRSSIVNEVNKKRRKSFGVKKEKKAEDGTDDVSKHNYERKGKKEFFLRQNDHESKFLAVKNLSRDFKYEFLKIVVKISQEQLKIFA